MNVLQRQLMIEQLSDSHTQAEKLNNLILLAQKGKTHLPHSQKLMAENVFKVAEIIESFTDSKFSKQYPYIEAVGFLECAYIGINKLVELSGKYSPNADRLMTGIGKAIVSHDECLGTSHTAEFTPQEYAYTGMLVAGAMYMVGLLERSRGKYMIGSGLKEYLLTYSQEDVNNVFSVEYTAMVCPPKPWTNSFDGGYLSKHRQLCNPLVSLRTKHPLVRKHYAALSPSRQPTVFKAINYLQSQSFRIDQSIPEHSNKLIFTIQGINNTDDFYLPVFLDSRGRVYYRSVLSPQGDPLTRAMVDFGSEHEEKLTDRGKYWLRVAVANAEGFDKARIDARAAYKPQGKGIVAQKYLSALNSDITSCMVQVDATCSGLGILSALTADPVGGYYTNLIDDGSEFKHDIYQQVSDLSNANYSLPYPTTRKRVKRVVMCSVYSLSALGALKYIKDAFEEDGINLEPKQAAVIAKAVTQSLKDTVPRAYELMDWLKKNVMNEWTTPAGFPVMQDYRKREDKWLRVNMAGIKRAKLSVVTDEIDNRKMRNSFVPNLIHSLDAAHLMMVTNRCADEGIPLAVIHDAYLTHPNHMDRLNVILREEYVRMITEARKLIDVPLGTLDIQDVMKSEFIFS